MIRKLLFTAALLASTTAVAAPAAKFLSDAIKGDNSEIRLGHLIAARGSNSEVRGFGDTLVRDHGHARVQAATVARHMGVPAPRSLAPGAGAEYAKLQHLRGHSFDREVKQYMIDDHQKDIAEFEDQAKNGDRRTAALASTQLPTLRKHLRIAQSLHD